MISRSFRLLLLVFAFVLTAHAQPSGQQNEPLHIPVNVSVFPGLSVADAVSGATGAPVISTFSFNIFAGRSYALEGVEFGGFWNDNAGYVRGAQFAGIANTVGGTVEGAQFAGIANLLGGSFSGAQFAGLANIAGESVRGVQSSGVVSIAGTDMVGLQSSGVVSMAGGKASGAQLSGIASIAGSDADVQFSGIASLSGGAATIIQVSGITNITGGNVRGVQIAGVANMAGERVQGAQIAGVINMAPSVRGLQLGVVNISDENRGVPIGLFSYVREVGLQYDVWADETGLISTAVRSGNRLVSNFVGVGVLAPSSDFRFATTAGLGLSTSLARRAHGSIDLITHALHGDSFKTWANLSKVRLVAGYDLSPQFAVFVAPTMNVFVSGDSDGSDLAPWSVYDSERGDVHVRMWPGFNVGVRVSPRGR